MNKDGGWKGAAIILAVLIIATIIGGAFLILFGKNAGSAGASDSAAKEELVADLPEEGETKVSDKVIVGIEMSSDTIADSTEEAETVTEEEKAEEEAVQEEQQATDTNVVVEEEVAKIREKYNVITSGISAGSYQKVSLGSGKTAYYDGSALVAVVVSKNTEGNSYGKFYYYDNQKLIFSYYEGTDAHRFYFYEDNLMRWRYSKNASNAQDAVNYDWETSSTYQKWESEVWTDGMSYI